VDNVSLVDRTIGELRASMEAAGTWNNSTVIISSDHPYRTWLWGSINQRKHGAKATSTAGLFAHVPLIVKLPGQHNAVRYERQFNTLVLHDLILALLHGDLQEPVELVNWLQENTTAQVAPVPILACPPFNGGSGGSGSIGQSRAAPAMVHAAD
jgi:Type I phosphodiesterase / nucleotide pyrophosphatase